jgi:aminoglycoside phosphotransferase (APT) family kinase protein
MTDHVSWRPGLARVATADGPMIRKSARVASLPDGGRPTSLRHEAAVMRLVAAVGGPSLAPVYADDDEILIPELVAFTRVDETLTRPAAALRKLFHAIGAALAAVHDVPVPDWLPPAVAEPLFLFPLTITEYATLAEPLVALLSTLDGLAGGDRLIALANRSSTPGAHLIHGDFKVDNILADHETVRFIDWELSGTGDPADDLAALAASVFAHALPAGARGSTQTLNAAVQWSWQLFAETLHGYQKRLDPVDLVERLAVKLFVRAQGAAAYAETQTTAPQLLLRAAVGLAKDPARNAQELVRHG